MSPSRGVIIDLDVQQIRTGDEAMVTKSSDGAEGELKQLLWQWRSYFMCAQVHFHLDLHSCVQIFSDTLAQLVLRKAGNPG